MRMRRVYCQRVAVALIIQYFYDRFLWRIIHCRLFTALLNTHKYAMANDEVGPKSGHTSSVPWIPSNAVSSVHNKRNNHRKTSIVFMHWLFWVQSHQKSIATYLGPCALVDNFFDILIYLLNENHLLDQINCWYDWCESSMELCLVWHES